MSAAKTLRLHVDPDKCQGHSRCKTIAPDLFVLDAFGHAQPVGDGRVPPDQAAQARLARANCPEYAIRLSCEAGR
jgi:ferredoxin